MKAFYICDPNAIALAASFHRVGIVIPMVEVTDDTDLLCVRCPNGKTHAGFPAPPGKVSAEQSIAGIIRTLVIQEGTVFVDCTEFHRISPCLSVVLRWLDVPNIVGVLLNRPVTGEISRLGNIDDTGPPPI